jgi:ribosomal protein L11 methyltransferase
MEEIILKTIQTSRRRLTPRVLATRLHENYALTPSRVKKVIRSLVRSGKLEYTYQFGCTFLEPAFNRPVRVSPKVVLKPPQRTYAANDGDIVIDVRPGASFGDGRHPTTRLAIKGIESVLKEAERRRIKRRTRILDIGTGTGVLVMAAVKGGIHSGVAVDLDPCAVSEARENVNLNGLQKRIAIHPGPVERIEGRFFMIIANLRFPGIVKLFPYMEKHLVSDGFIVLSGIKTEEITALMELAEKKRFKVRWREGENGWEAVVLTKKAGAVI